MGQDKKMKEHRELLLDLLYDVSKAHEEAMETTEDDIFWEKWSELDKTIRAAAPRTYDMVLVEKQAGDGIPPEELCRFAELFPDGSALIPIEIDSHNGNSTAMGFITKTAEAKYLAEHSPEALEMQIGWILSDPERMNASGEYNMDGLSVYLSRKI